MPYERRLIEKSKEKNICLVTFKRLNKLAQLPKYETSGAAGFDLTSIESEIIRPGERKLIRTGLAVELPEGMELQLRARSGLALKHGITLMNGIGTIDSDYRGEIGVILVNLGQEDFNVTAGMRICQGVVTSYTKATIGEVVKLSETARGVNGFGSTGK